MVEGYRILFHRYPFLKNRQRKTITGFVRFALSDPVSIWTLDLPVSIWTLDLPVSIWTPDQPETIRTQALL